MDRYSIEYLTGSSQGTFTQPLNMAQITFSHHDGIMTADGRNYLNNSLHLDDVYSVISRDVASSDAKTEAVNHPSEFNVVDLTKDDAMRTSRPIHNSEAPSLDDVTPVPSPTGSQDAHSLERGTPSPNPDSGIESDISPGLSYDNTLHRNKEPLGKLNQKASAVQRHGRSDAKPKDSYITLIARAILSAADEKMALGDIYRYITEHYQYYDNEEKAWRNSIRYNLSINECFVKAGKEESGKGNYWAIHPNCVDDFKRGDFRRRQARRRARRNLKTLPSNPTTSKTAPPNAYVTMTPTYPMYQPYPSFHDKQFHGKQTTPGFFQFTGYPAGSQMPQTPYYPPVTGHSGLQDYRHPKSAKCPEVDVKKLYEAYTDMFWRVRASPEAWLAKQEGIPNENTVIIQ